MLTLFFTWCFTLYWNNRCYTASLLLVTCWLPKNIPSQSTTALILSVFCNTQNVQRKQLQHLTSLLLLSVMQNCVDRGPQVRLADVTRVWITEAQLTCLLLCPSDLDTTRREEFAKMVVVLWFWFVLISHHGSLRFWSCWCDAGGFPWSFGVRQFLGTPLTLKPVLWSWWLRDRFQWEPGILSVTCSWSGRRWARTGRWKKSHIRPWPQTSPTEKETAWNRKQGNRIYCAMVTRSSEGSNCPDPQERITSMLHFW